MSCNDENRVRLKNLTLDQVREMVTAMGEPSFRSRQIVKWVYQKRLDRFEHMNNMPKETRRRLEEKFTIAKMAPAVVLESKHGDAVKFGFELIESAHMVESVLLYDDDRRTACLSSQLGCGLGCAFCETAKLGFIRNLALDEIVGQLIGINDYLVSRGDKLVTNIVFMGMGEALSNFANFRSSLQIIMDEDAFNIGARRLTVSTAGVVPSIERLMAEELTIGLAISLNAYSNAQRDRLMPINTKYPIEELVAIAEKYFEKTGRRVTFEYVVIEGETDTPEAARALKRYLGSFPCKLNLIPVNPSSGAHLPSPSDRAVAQFSDVLHGLGLSATIRKSRGRDISGACGQLTGKAIGRES